MLRHALILLGASATVALFAPGCSPAQLTLSDYDQSCMDASECVAVYVGDCSSCMCPNAAINQVDLAKYQGDEAALGCMTGQNCDCAMPIITCSNGTCGLGKATP
jgi:hypothetical protein